MYTGIYLVNMYTHLGEIHYKYIMQHYHCLYYIEDQTIHIYGKIDQCFYDTYYIP